MSFGRDANEISKHKYIWEYSRTWLFDNGASTLEPLALERRTTHVENFLPQIATFFQFQVYLNVTHAQTMTSLLLVNNFYPVMSYRQVQEEEESDELLYTARSLVMVREPVTSARG